MTLQRRSIALLIVMVGALGLGLALALEQGLGEHIGTDFHVFWQAGRNFASGSPLYHEYLPGARPLKYPPFAALVFQLLALFPLRVAAVLFALLNLALWVVAVYLTRDIVERTLPRRNPGRFPLVLAVVFSAQFFLDNFHHGQVNGLILVLVLLGIRAYLSEKDVWAAVCFVGATAIKITPIFFVAWLLIRGRRRAALAVPPIALACVLVPLVVRGPTTGGAELVEYYHSFLEGHQHGRISQYSGGQNLAALVNRMTRPNENAEHVTYRYLPASERTAQVVYQVLWATVLVVFLAKLVLLRVWRAPCSAFEFSLIFLTGLLLSPVTFTTHLVSFLFVFSSFLTIRPTTLSFAGRVVAAVLLVVMGFTGLNGRDLMGSTVYLYAHGYSTYVWTQLLLFSAAVVLAGRMFPVTRASSVRIDQSPA